MTKHNAIIEIKKKSLINNYNKISKFAKNSIVGATIKADAYGIGALEAFKIFYKIGCRHFFVASLNEAIAIREKYKKGNLYVLNGLENNDFDIYNREKIIPILVSRDELNKFKKSKFYKKKDFKLGIHIDTGINRLGINIRDLDIKISKKLDIYILISHFASADELSNPYNNKQYNKFKLLKNKFKKIQYLSLANSAGIISNKKFHYDIIRPGISLYGGYENKKLKEMMPLKNIIKLKAKILQIKNINKNEYIGYNQTYKTTKKIQVAILGIGYGDGIPRNLSNKGFVFFKKNKFRIIGRISMDTLTIDISNTKNKIEVGKYMELINNEFDLEHFAKKANIISREILTSITQRVKRIYI